MDKSGGLYGSWTLSDEYGFTDVDGNRPHLGRHFEQTYGGWPTADSEEIHHRWSVSKTASTPAVHR
jgi:hypothetical protein